jgi:Lon-like protease
VDRRVATIAGALALLLSIAVLGSVLPAPFVALGRGPTFDTLGAVDGTEVVAIRNLPTFPTSGHLNMTTVGVETQLTMLNALAFWVADDRRVVPRSTLFPPEIPPAEVAEQNRQQFLDSQTAAEVAALGYLGLPTTVLVEGLTEGSASAGVLAPQDVILAVAGRPVDTFDDLRGALVGTHPGQQVIVRFQRGDAPPQEATVTLGPRPDGPDGALGLLPGVRPSDDNDVVISLGDVGGPSAGLMFALAVVDKLTPGELTGGRFIAGTGTIGPFGTVGPINGIPFKMLVASEVGATVFLVPTANCAEALATAPEGLQLVRVDDLAGAVAALETLDAGGVPASC